MQDRIQVIRITSYNVCYTKLLRKYAIDRLGEDVVRARYGNLFDMYEEITDENPYKTPMMIFPAIHYTMGGIWFVYELMTSIPGLFAIGECIV